MYESYQKLQLMASISSQTNHRGKWLVGRGQLGPGDHGGRLGLGTSKRLCEF